MTETKASWLRSEIKKLEGEKDTNWFRENNLVSPLESHRVYDMEYGHDTALTSIITRYKEELKVLETHNDFQE